MSAISAFINPAQSNELMVFYNTLNLNIALQTRKASDVASNVSAFTAEGMPGEDGRVMNPSTMTALNFKNLVAIYGVNRSVTTSKCPCQPSCPGLITNAETYGEVCLLSPAFQPLGLLSEAKYGRITASQDPSEDGDAWIYYRKSTESPEKIREFSLTDPNVEEAILDNADHVGDQTYLAAYFDTDQLERHIVYQYPDGTVHDYNISLDGSKTVGLSDAYTPTGLAVIFIPSNGQAYLYYSNFSAGKYNLRKAVRAKNGIWGSSVPLDKAPKLSQTTQISVTCTPDTSKNHVVFTGTKGTFEHFIDAW